VLGPQRELHSRFDAAWCLGLLMLLAFLAQQTARRLRLPALVGWIGAGLLLGPSGLQTVQPASSHLLGQILLFAAMWVGLQTGLKFYWPAIGRGWRLPGVIALSTFVTFLLASAAIAFLTQPPWWFALLAGVLACLWGPFTVTNLVERKDIAALAALGAGCSLILLSAVLGLLHGRGVLAASGLRLVGLLWLSLLAGGLAAELLYRLRLLAARGTAFAGLCATFALGALLLPHVGLFALPLGFGAGLVLSRHRNRSGEAIYSLPTANPLASMVFFALAGTAIDLRVLWPPAAGLPEILLIQFAALILVRGLGPVLWYPLRPDETDRTRHSGWLLLPSGALLFEMLNRSDGLAALLQGKDADLLRQIALSDVLIPSLFFSLLAAFLWRRSRRPIHRA
jgi:Kef-type K+ transport system membrane component KefB